MSDEWEVLVMGEVYQNNEGYDLEEGDQFDEIEVSVIKVDNKFGHSSYGWDGMDKIILLKDRIDSHEELVFAVVSATILSAGLNRR